VRFYSQRSGAQPPFIVTTTIMKIYSLAVILAPPSGPSATLCQGSDLSSFSFYQKGSVGEFLSFFTKTVAERTGQGARQTVQENNYTAHVYNRGGAEQLAGQPFFSIAQYKELD
jgi:synaptobrevin family protein YKT6